jgi:ribonuclease T2
VEPTTAFTLHGLWPERSDGSYPSDCTQEKFDPTVIEPIAAEMGEFWPSLSGSNTTFWAHEYEKHGTCAEDVLKTQLEFFNTTLGLRAVYDITPALAMSGISPSATQGFSRAAFDAAMIKSFDFPVLPACDSKGQLTGATVCISKSFRSMSCGDVTYGSCKAQTLYLIPAQ